MSNTYKHIFVSVHGIGKQQRSAIVRAVANRLASSHILYEEDKIPFHPQPLGYFDGLASDLGAHSIDKENQIAVAEVFWADLPQNVVNEGRTIEETKSWANTVVARARKAYKDAAEKNPTGLETVPTPDFGLASEVLEEIIDTVRVIEKLFLVGSFAGLPKFDVRKVFEEFLGDVQLMADFKQTRNVIIGRFQAVMAQLSSAHPEARFHIVAHSEGTVVSFLGMLYAMSGKVFDQATGEETKNDELPRWVKQIKGFMTIGSPIDKHLLLWPELFEGLDLKVGAEYYNPENASIPSGAKIKWRNYYDFGDPIGFKLDCARRWLIEKEKALKKEEPIKKKEPELFAFAFSEDDDHGFARYLFPGKAHNDYWDDKAVFDHYLQSAVIDGELKNGAEVSSKAKALVPKSIIGVRCLSPIFPYILSFLLFGLAVTVMNYSFARFMVIRCDSILESIRNIFGTTSFLAGLTLAARIPRLAAGKWWIFWGVIAFAIGATIYCTATQDFRGDFGLAFKRLSNESTTLLTVWTIAAAALISILGYLLSAKRQWYNSDKRKGVQSQSLPEVDERKPRWFRRGMRPLLLCGVIIVSYFLGVRINNHVNKAEEAEKTRKVASKAHDDAKAAKEKSVGDALVKAAAEVQRTANELTIAVEAAKEAKTEKFGDALPAIIGSVLFFYLWWFAALIFDLGFVWQRYIRQSLLEDRIEAWRKLGEGKAKGSL